MAETKKAFPLNWPVGYKRTEHRKDSGFRQTAGKAQDSLKSALNRLGAKEIIVSSNAMLQRDGSMYADAMGIQSDPGVAVYFKYKGNPVVLCCDTFMRIWENVYAIAKTVENLRTIERYGVSDFLNRSFTGFAELPPPMITPFKRTWHEVLGVPKNANAFQIKEAFRIKASMVHPDKGGTNEQFQEAKNAFDEAMQQFNS